MENVGAMTPPMTQMMNQVDAKDDPSEKKQANLHQWPCQRFKNTLEKNLCFLEEEIGPFYT